MGKARVAVEAKGAGILRGDDGIQHPVTLVLQKRFQGPVQPPADAPALGIGPQVDGAFGAPAVGRPRIWAWPAP